mmetsp:Transcript_37487/g.76912  ORF Transcript_37487/g.76912 Transcript_37487/m.76912 type:complete len:202 (-) Transcript_37487:931-1536(-)
MIGRVDFGARPEMLAGASHVRQRAPHHPIAVRGRALILICYPCLPLHLEGGGVGDGALLKPNVRLPVLACHHQLVPLQQLRVLLVGDEGIDFVVQRLPRRSLVRLLRADVGFAGEVEPVVEVAHPDAVVELVEEGAVGEAEVDAPRDLAVVLVAPLRLVLVGGEMGVDEGDPRVPQLHNRRHPSLVVHHVPQPRRLARRFR